MTLEVTLGTPRVGVHERDCGRLGDGCQLLGIRVGSKGDVPNLLEKLKTA